MLQDTSGAGVELLDRASRGNEDRLAVRRPRRAARRRSVLEPVQRPSRRLDHEEAPLALDLTQKSDTRAVWRPAGKGVVLPGSEPADAATVEVRNENPGAQPREHDPLAVGSKRGIRGVELALGDLLKPFTVGLNAEE